MIGVVTNPRAGKNIVNPARIEGLRQILGTAGILREAGGLDEMADIGREFRRSAVDILVVDGGDGTLHHTLSAFIPIYSGVAFPPIVLSRGGTMNTVANSLGMRGVSEAVLGEVVNASKGGGEFEVIGANALKVNDGYGFIFGLGFPVSLLNAYYRGKRRGRGKTVAVLLKILLSALEKPGPGNLFFRPFEAGIWVDGQKLPIRRFTTILCSTVKGVGLGFKPTRRAGEAGGVFQMLCLDMGPRKMVMNAVRVFLGMELRGERLFDRMASRSVITLREPAEIQVDGEMFGNQKEIRLQVGPALRFIRTRS